MIAGKWQQHELWDGTYTITDWMDCVEMLSVEAENRARDFEAAEERSRGQ